MTEPLMLGTPYTVSEYYRRQAKRKAAQEQFEPYGEFIFGLFQLAICVGFVWGCVALVKFMWMHS